ncbi:MAG TPA: ATP synthase F1 subunit gamma [Candidatus Moranbacteria bacterium]|nr:ATP synthase F1 subunit gamma [Candidatus Moranbacteria bacterium]
MAKGGKEVQRRIKSISNTRKITRAMEMVAAAKMRKEVEKVLAVRSYATSAWGILTNLSRAFGKHKHGLLEVREVRRILVVLVTSNRGLCGAYNSQVVKKIMEQIKNPKLLKINRVGEKKLVSSVSDKDLKVDFIAVGKKGFEQLRLREQNVIAEFGELNYLPSADAVRPLAHIIINDYQAEKYDKVVIAYTDYKNTLVQEPKLRQLLPISKTDIEKQIEQMSLEEKGEKITSAEEKIIDYKIEPEPQEVLEHLLPRLVEMQIYHAILESNASEESARMMAMKNATEAAGEMMEELHYTYNQIRQMSITQEIAEITSGRVALED